MNEPKQSAVERLTDAQLRVFIDEAHEWHDPLSLLIALGCANELLKRREIKICELEDLVKMYKSQLEAIEDLFTPEEMENIMARYGKDD